MHGTIIVIGGPTAVGKQLFPLRWLRILIQPLYHVILDSATGK